MYWYYVTWRVFSSANLDHGESWPMYVTENESSLQACWQRWFRLQAWDDRRCTLSAVTAGIRSNWMTAVRRAAGLQEIPTPSDISMAMTLGEKLERKLDNGHQ